ncbi:protein kinase domain-containing protein [Colletotrichum filicis]|nr:protein kinase domain-containing protein [Colletotrichum filicis]
MHSVMNVRQMFEGLLCGVSTEAKMKTSLDSDENSIEKDGISQILPLRRAWTEGSSPANQAVKKSSYRRRHTFSHSSTETTQQRQSLPPIPLTRWRRKSNNRTTMLSLSHLQERLKEATLKVRNNRDDRTYNWIPILCIREILDNHDAIVQAFRNEHFEIGHKMNIFMFEEAMTLVALLIRRGHHKWLSLFHDNGFGNKYFPIEFQSVKIDQSSQEWTVGSYKSNKSTKSVSFEVTANTVNGISKKDDDELGNFCNQYQWEFFVPVFAPNEPAHVFDPRCPMPFLDEFEPYATNFSIVRHFVIHRSHLNFPRDDQIGTVVDAEDNPHVAVKELLSAQGLTVDKFQYLAKNEATILTRLRDQDHPHFIRAIASYTQGNRHFFVFPWARGGNLRNFWESQPSLSAASEETSTQDWNTYLEWFFEQLLGLASAIKNLHHPRDDPNESCRHGDLKPENILCFSKNEDAIGKGRIPVGVLLVVADAGHAKVHEMATEFRGSPTTTPKGTIMYSPPEADIKKARSRRYDIWSLGCLYLESLIWMMYGYEALKSFHQDVGPGEPYFVKDPTVDLKHAVKEWIKAIKIDPRCAPVKKTAVGCLVSLIEERMLIPRVTIKDTGNTQQSTPPDVTQQSASPQMIVRQATIPLTESPERADAKEVHKKMEEIISAGKGSHHFTWMVRDPEAAARGPPIIIRALGTVDNRRRSKSHESLGHKTEVSQD